MLTNEEKKGSPEEGERGTSKGVSTRISNKKKTKGMKIEKEDKEILRVEPLT